MIAFVTDQHGALAQPLRRLDAFAKEIARDPDSRRAECKNDWRRAAVKEV